MAADFDINARLPYFASLAMGRADATKVKNITIR